MITNPIAFSYFVADGTTTEFSYAFNGTTGFDTKVASEVKAAVLNPDNTRDLNPNFAVLQDVYGNLNGMIKFAAAPVAGAIILIARQTEITQEMSIATSSGFDAKALEKALDKLTKIAQELNLHGRQKTLQLDLFQEISLSLQKLSAENQGQYLLVDFANGQVKAGLMMEITNGNFRVSLDGQTWINLPKSSLIQEFRQTVLQNPTSYVFEYRVGDVWYNVTAGIMHNELLGRDVEGAHPMTSIIGLVAALNSKVSKSNQPTIIYGRAGGAETDYVPTDIFDDAGDSTHLVTTKGLSGSFATPLALDNKGASMADLGVVNDALQAQITENANNITENANEITNLQADKLDKNQGTDNNGKFLTVGPDGNIELKAIDEGGLQFVTHDETLSGAGTTGSPLKISDDITAEQRQLRTDVETLSGEVATNQNDIAELGDQVSGIESKIPGDASPQNQLATNEQIVNLNDAKQDNISAGFGIKITGTTIAIADVVDCGTLG